MYIYIYIWICLKTLLKFKTTENHEPQTLHNMYP